MKHILIVLLITLMSMETLIMNNEDYNPTWRPPQPNTGGTKGGRTGNTSTQTTPRASTGTTNGRTPETSPQTTPRSPGSKGGRNNNHNNGGNPPPVWWQPPLDAVVTTGAENILGAAANNPWVNAAMGAFNFLSMMNNMVNGGGTIGGRTPGATIGGRDMSTGTWGARSFGTWGGRNMDGIAPDQRKGFSNGGGGGFGYGGGYGGGGRGGGGGGGNDYMPAWALGLNNWNFNE